MNKVYAVQIGDLISTSKTFPTVGSLVSILVANAFIIAGIIAFIFIILGGFGIITGAGDPKKMDQGKNTLTMAIVGLLVVIFSYWIVQLIGLMIGFNPLEVPTQ